MKNTDFNNFKPEDGNYLKRWDLYEPLFDNFYILGPEVFNPSCEPTCLYQYPLKFKKKADKKETNLSNQEKGESETSSTEVEETNSKNNTEIILETDGNQLTQFLFPDGIHFIENDQSIQSSDWSIAETFTKRPKVYDHIIFIKSDGSTPHYYFCLRFRCSPYSRPAVFCLKEIEQLTNSFQNFDNDQNFMSEKVKKFYLEKMKKYFINDFIIHNTAQICPSCLFAFCFETQHPFHDLYFKLIKDIVYVESSERSMARNLHSLIHDNELNIPIAKFHSYNQINRQDEDDFIMIDIIDSGTFSGSSGIFAIKDLSSSSETCFSPRNPNSGRKSESNRNSRKNSEIIEFNQNSGSIESNQNSGSIESNQNSGSIESNQNSGSIESNQNSGSIESNQNSGSIESNQNSGSIESNQNSGSIESNQNSGSIESNQNSGSIESNQNSGSIEFNQNSGSIESNQNSGSIESNQNSGSIESNQNSGSIESNQNSGSIESNQNSGSIESNQNSGSIESNQNSGSIESNQNSGSIESNQNSGSIESNQNSGSIESNQNSGSIESNQNSGSIEFNQNSGSIESNQNSGSIESNQNSGSIESNQNSGSIESNQNSGSIESNQNSGSIESNQNSGSIESNQNSGSIESNQNSGSIESNQNSGSIESNQNSGSIESNQNSGSIESNQNSGSIEFNQNSGSIESNQNSGSIESNQNSGSIESNQNSGSIESNQNSGSIESNQNSGSIESNQNSGSIESNQNSGSIESNQNSGSIESNQNSGSIESNQNSGSIESNQNSGSIESNQNSGSIESNQNSGSIESNQNSGSIESNQNSGSIESNQNDMEYGNSQARRNSENLEISQNSGIKRNSEINGNGQARSNSENDGIKSSNGDNGSTENCKNSEFSASEGLNSENDECCGPIESRRSSEFSASNSSFHESSSGTPRAINHNGKSSSSGSFTHTERYLQTVEQSQTSYNDENDLNFSWPENAFNARDNLLRILYDDIVLPAIGEEIALMINRSILTKFVWRRPTIEQYCTKLSIYGIEPLLEWITLTDFIHLLSLIFLEYNVIVSGTEVEPIVRVVSSLPHIIFPFAWMMTIMTIVPESILDILDSPVTFLAGVFKKEKSVNKIVQITDVNNIVIIDMDDHIITWPKNPHPNIACFDIYFNSLKKFCSQNKNNIKCSEKVSKNSNVIFIHDNSLTKNQRGLKIKKLSLNLNKKKNPWYFDLSKVVDIVNCVLKNNHDVFVSKIQPAIVTRVLRDKIDQHGSGAVGSMMVDELYLSQFHDKKNDWPFVELFMNSQMFISYRELSCRLKSDDIVDNMSVNPKTLYASSQLKKDNASIMSGFDINKI